MALPDDPFFDAQTLSTYNARLRSLGMGPRAEKEIAAYLGVGANTVRAWFFPQKTQQGPATVQIVVVPWEGFGSKAELINIVSRSRSNFKRSDVLDYFNNALGYRLAKGTTKADLVAIMRAPSFRKSLVGNLMDAIFPREQETQAPGRVLTLPDMLDPSDYLNQNLSAFPRGQLLRQKADLALALLGEVVQTPQDGVEESAFLLRAASLQEAEDVYLWPLRVGYGSAGWLSPFIAEMWFRAELTPGPELGKSAPAGDRNAPMLNWVIKVDYYRVYEATDLEFTSGWPTRDDLPDRNKRTKQQIEDKIKEKAEWEAYKKAKAKKRRDKSKRSKR
jgi:hypothetical protein